MAKKLAVVMEPKDHRSRPILSQLNRFQMFTIYFWKVRSNVTLSSTLRNPVWPLYTTRFVP